MYVMPLILGLLISLPGCMPNEDEKQQRRNAIITNWLKNQETSKRNTNTNSGRETSKHSIDAVGTIENEDTNLDMEKNVLLDSKSLNSEKDSHSTSPKEQSKTTSSSSNNVHPTPQGVVAGPEKTPDKDTGSKIIGFATNDFLFIAFTTACSLAALIGIVVAGVCWYNVRKNAKAASTSEYPAYGAEDKGRMPPLADRKMAHSAQMYHYQHQKQQMLAMEKANEEMKHDASDDESEEENGDGDYTVYECPGLAPPGEMEVVNPFFNEEALVAAAAGERKEEPKK